MKDDESIECLLCGNAAALKHSAYPGYQEPVTFKIYHCPGCNTAFSLPRVETSDIYEYIYLNGDKVPGYDRYWKYAQNIKTASNPLEYLSETEETYWSVKEALSLYVKDKTTTKILEIGSGLGYLTYSLLKENYNATGLDISQTAVKQANETFGDHYICADLYEYSQHNPASFDIVILTEVIEHIDKPLDFIESILKLLKSGGRAIITTPNKTIYPTNTIWASDHPPVHCWWFSEGSMQYIAKRFNISLNFMDFTNFYKHNYLPIDMKAVAENKLPKPYFNKTGELIITATKTDPDSKTSNNSESLLRNLMRQVPYVKKQYRKLKEFLNPNLKVCKDQGIILCAIIQKR
jgi:2-polyprenyl-3-methyl-5-hydroxy-6-metoxy-1,4-benzoquinol methylase